MGLWQIIQAEESTNYVRNPSAEVATGTTTGAAATSVTRRYAGEQVGASVLFGLRAWYVQTSAVGDVLAWDLSPLPAGSSFFVSFYVKGTFTPAHWRVSLDGGANWSNLATVETLGDWARIGAAFAHDAQDLVELRLVHDTTDAEVFYVDGVQVEAKDHATTYIDGDVAGCFWTKVKHASASKRLARSRVGGRVIDLEDDLGLRVRFAQGIGMAFGAHRVGQSALKAGGYFYGRHIEPRTISLTVQATGTALANLHATRQSLIDLIRPDVTGADVPFVLRYSGANANRPLDIDVVYDSGLELDTEDGTFEEFQLRLMAYNEPFFRELATETHLLNHRTNNYSVYQIMTREEGVWSVLPAIADARLDGYVYDLQRGPDGRIYVCGDFDTGSYDNIYVYDEDTSTWDWVGGGVDETVYCMTFAPDGTLYIGGLFHWVGGFAPIAAHRIAKYDPVADAWANIGDTAGGSVDDSVYAMAFGPDGWLYVAGNFTSIGGVSSNGLARYNGSSWQDLGTLTTGRDFSAERAITCMTFGLDGTLYLGGEMTGGIVSWRVDTDSTFIWVDLGEGLDGSVTSIVQGTDGRIYVGGSFSEADGALEVNGIAAWNGSSWEKVGAGILVGTPSVTDLGIEPDTGSLWIGGEFTRIGGRIVPVGVVKWTGGDYATVDISVPSNGAFRRFLIERERMYLAFRVTSVSSVQMSYTTTVTNSGTRAVRPIFTIEHQEGEPAQSYWLKNETTGQTVYLNLTTRAGETVTIDFDSRVMSSSYYGNVWRGVLRASDLDFSLIPGDNLITCFVDDSDGGTVKTFLTWRNSHWSADGVAS